MEVSYDLQFNTTFFPENTVARIAPVDILKLVTGNFLYCNPIGGEALSPKTPRSGLILGSALVTSIDVTDH